MPVMQAVGGGVGGGNFGNQRLGSDGAECLRLFVFFTAQGLGNQFFDTALVGTDLQLVFGKLRRQQGAYALVDFGHIVLTERNVGTVHVGKELQGVAVYGNRVNGDMSYGYFFSCSGVQKLAYFPAGFCRKLLRTARLGDKGGGKHAEQKVESYTHDDDVLS